MARNISGNDLFGDLVGNDSMAKKTESAAKAPEQAVVANDSVLKVIPTTGEVSDSISPYPSQESSEFPTIVLDAAAYKEYYDSIKSGMKKNKVRKDKRMTFIPTDENYDYLFFESKKRGLTMQEFANEIIAKYSVSKEGHVMLK